MNKINTDTTDISSFFSDIEQIKYVFNFFKSIKITEPVVLILLLLLTSVIAIFVLYFTFKYIKRKNIIGKNKKITVNFLSLSILQGANILLPLITFPYLVRVLGVNKFGLIMFSQAFMTYFSMIADYGFNLSGAREISIHRNNKEKIEKIFNSIMIARLWLVMLGFIVMNIVVFSFDKFSINWKLYYSTYAMVIGTAFFPVWFFQGMEKMVYISILTVVAKTFYTLSIFLFVQSSSDYIYVPLINSLGYIFVGFFSLYIIVSKFDIQFKLQRYKRVKVQIIRGWNIFVSKIATNIYTSTNIFILGIFTNEVTVGYYSIADKAVRVCTFIFVPFNQAIYPHIVQLVKISKKESIVFIKTILKYIMIISLFIWGVVNYFSDFIFYTVFGDINKEVLLIFKTLSILIIILPISSILFNTVLLAFRLDRFFLKIYFLGSVSNIFFIIILFSLIDSKVTSISLSLIITEILVTVAAIIIFRKKILF